MEFNGCVCARSSYISASDISAMDLLNQKLGHGCFGPCILVEWNGLTMTIFTPTTHTMVGGFWHAEIGIILDQCVKAHLRIVSSRKTLVCATPWSKPRRNVWRSWVVQLSSCPESTRHIWRQLGCRSCRKEVTFGASSAAGAAG